MNAKIFLRKHIFRMAMAVVLASPMVLGQSQHHSRHRAAAKLDINTATLAQLEAIPGLGEVYSKRIIAGRPYTSKRQLSTRGILPKDLYMQIKPRLIAHRAKKKPQQS